MEGVYTSNTYTHEGHTVETLEDITEEHVVQTREKIAQIRTTTDTNLLYYQCLQLLEYSKLSAEIPRLVVFGQQSMGKTTLLDFIMGGPIGYSSTDTATKQPVVIMMNPSSNNTIECTIDNKRVDIRTLQNSMAARMKAAGDQISEEELKVEIFIPGGVYAVFVDLPGIKDDSKEGSAFTRSVVRNYVRHNPNDLYILVKKSSDDPANWPWSLKDFILSAAPKGLGLTQRQTIVVGTRAREFLENEKSDIHTQNELLNRVTKRAVTDSQKLPFPLYLLELHSLPVELKQSSDFQLQKATMYEQIKAGQQAVTQLIMQSFDQSPNIQTRQNLLEYFSNNKFKETLNSKFQSLLNDQLSSLEKRLLRKRTDLRRQILDLERKLSDRSPNAYRENINHFIRRLTQVISDFLTGNYVVMRHPENGVQFLNKFGGSLVENLEEGDQLAKDLFPDNMAYNESFYQTIKEETQKIASEEKAVHFDPFPGGQSVRFMISRNTQIQMYGVIDNATEGQQGDTQTPVGTHIETTQQTNTQATPHAETNNTHTREVTSTLHDNTQISVNFYTHSTQETAGTTQKKEVFTDRLRPIRPLKSVLEKDSLIANTQDNTYSCWLKFVRHDLWYGIMPVEIDMAVANELTSFSNSEITVKSTIQNTQTDGTTSPFTNYTVEISDLYVDYTEEDMNPSKNEGFGTKGVAARNLRKYAEIKLLNQLSLTCLSSYMQLQMASLEPDYRISHQVMLQMMRSVKKVIDKSDWEPLVADLLQTNIRGGIINLTKLISCSAAIALRRIVMAAFHEMKRFAESTYAESSMMYLADNIRFMNELKYALEEYCRSKALACIQTMENLIFEQTYAIRFEIVQDLFEGCSQYEEEFLGTKKLRDVIKRISSMNTQQTLTTGTPESKFNFDDDSMFDRIYTEVRMQFWVTKMLLSVPLSTKIYIHFVKEVIDKTSHLASNSNIKLVGESDLERFLNRSLLCEEVSEGEYKERNDTDLFEHYEFSYDFNLLQKKLEGFKRVEEYVKLAQEAISKLRHQMTRYSSVDFLTRLNVEIDEYLITSEEENSQKTSKSSEKSIEASMRENGKT